MSNRYSGAIQRAPRQSPVSAPRFTPANDNIRPRVPLPANDNVPGRGFLPDKPPGVPPAIFRRMAMRIALRALPMIGWAWTAFELYRWWRDWQASRADVPPYGWVKTAEAPVPIHFFGHTGTWEGSAAWMERSYLLGHVRATPRQISPLDDLNPPQNPHYWWYDATFPEGFPERLIAVRSVWQRDLSIPTPDIRPPRTIILPPIAPLPYPDPLPLPLSPTPVPVPRPVRDPYAPYLSVNLENPNPVGYGPSPALPPVETPRLAARPGRREKERKVQTSSAMRRFLGRTLSNYSEVGDAVDAFYDALPKRFQNEDDKTIADKMRTLYEHWDKVEMDKAMTNLVRDMVEDPKLAKAFRKMQQEQEKAGLELGGIRGIQGSSGLWPRT